jgi:hypothetical protein
MDTRRALIEALEHVAESDTADSFSAAFAFIRGYVTTRSYLQGRDDELSVAFEKAQQAILERTGFRRPRC